MALINCPGCGKTISNMAKECPECGYSFENENVISEKSRKAKKVYVPSVIALIIGICIIALGVTVYDEKVGISTHSSKYNSVLSYSFGADFYTEMYNASSTMVSELNDIDSGLAVATSGIQNLGYIIYKSVGMLIIVLGLGVVAIAIINIQK